MNIFSKFEKTQIEKRERKTLVSFGKFYFQFDKIFK